MIEDGRVIVGPVSEKAVTATIDALRAAGAREIAVESATDRNGKTRHVVWGAKSPQEP